MYPCVPPSLRLMLECMRRSDGAVAVSFLYYILRVCVYICCVVRIIYCVVYAGTQTICCEVYVRTQIIYCAVYTGTHVICGAV